MQDFRIYRLHITFQAAIRHHHWGLYHRPQVLGNRGYQRLVESPACREIVNETPRVNVPGPGAVCNHPDHCKYYSVRPIEKFMETF